MFESRRVPGVYLTWANSLFLAYFAFNGINNLRAFNVAFSPIPTAPTNLTHSTAFVFGFDTNSLLTPIELIHCETLNSCRTDFNSVSLLVAYDVSVDFERYPCVIVPELLLHHSRGCTVRKQGTSSTMPHGMKTASWYSQFLKERMQNLFPQLVS